MLEPAVADASRTAARLFCSNGTFSASKPAVDSTLSILTSAIGLPEVTVTAAEYNRLAKAVQLDRSAALKSA